LPKKQLMNFDSNLWICPKICFHMLKLLRYRVQQLRKFRRTNPAISGHLLQWGTILLELSVDVSTYECFWLPMLRIADKEPNTAEGSGDDDDDDDDDEHGESSSNLCNNESQTEAVRSAMSNRLTLIQGPPGLFVLLLFLHPSA